MAKRIVSDGEGASKFITINVSKCKNEIDAKKIALSVANSPLVKTAISGEDPSQAAALRFFYVRFSMLYVCAPPQHIICAASMEKVTRAHVQSKFRQIYI